MGAHALVLRAGLRIYLCHRLLAARRRIPQTSRNYPRRVGTGEEGDRRRSADKTIINGKPLW